METKIIETDDWGLYPSLKDRVVFITGGASGIGAEIVRAFVKQRAKAGFVDLDETTPQKLQDELDGQTVYETCDLLDINALQRAFENLGSELGPADVLVNNAARDDRHQWDKVTPEYWDERVATGCGLRMMSSATAFSAKLVDFLPDLSPASGGVYERAQA